MSGIYLRRPPPAGAATCARALVPTDQSSWTLIDESEIDAATDELRHELGIAEGAADSSTGAGSSSTLGIELGVLPPDAANATLATSPKHLTTLGSGATPEGVVALGSDLARDPAVQAQVLATLSSGGSRAVTTAQPHMVRGATAVDLASADSAQLEILRNEVRDLKSQLRTLLDEHRAAREAAAPAPPPPPEQERRCVEGSLGVATLLLARCLVRRQTQRQSTACACPFATCANAGACPFLVCANAAATAASCFAPGPAELVRDVRA